MVCKEEVLLWFKDLESCKRIDVMYELLNMCLPFEIRFLGSCIEEIGKHSYQELRGSAIIANDIDKLTKDTSLTDGLIDESVRHRVLIYLSLLSSRNCNCANWFYKTLLRTEWVENTVLKGSYRDDEVQNELLLLFTMGVHHPAFTFDQKGFFGNMLGAIIEQRESKKYMMASKPFAGCPPGFGFANVQKIGYTEIPIIPIKTVPPICHGDPGLQHGHYLGGTPVEILPAWGRPGYVGPVCGAPEMAAFPSQPVSPLISQPTSPTLSRAASPPRPLPFRHAPGLQTSNQLADVTPNAIPRNLLSHSPFTSELKVDDDLNQIPDDKLRDAPWLNSVMLHVDMKQPNGIRFGSFNKIPQQYFLDQMQALNLEGENSLHCSSSSSSSNNSINNESPPSTPTATPAVPYHGPGRGETKSRINGVPHFAKNTQSLNSSSNLPPLPSAPPAASPALSNCSVPYSNYPPQVTLTALPNRSVFHYTHSYRPPFSTPFSYQQPTHEIYYSCPYMPVVFSSTPSQVPSRNTNCFNCGATGHTGAECSGQTIEEITQKKTYSLEYNSPLPDADK